MIRRMRVSVLLSAASIVAGCAVEQAPPEAIPSQQAFVPPPPPTSFPFAAPFQPEVNDFKGKYVAVSHVFGDELETTVLHSPTVKKLGNRDFLVGEIVWEEEGAGEKKKASNWLPVEIIDSMVVFENKDQALKEAVGPDGQKM